MAYFPVTSRDVTYLFYSVRCALRSSEGLNAQMLDFGKQVEQPFYKENTCIVPSTWVWISIIVTETLYRGLNLGRH
jgi:hypothetical protein